MKEIAFGNSKIKYEIRRSKREKTVALVIQPNTSVVVLSPEFLSENKIRQIVVKRAAWIINQQEKIRKFKTENPPKEYVSGESFTYLGRQYRLKVVRADDNEKGLCKLVGGRFYVTVAKKMEGKSVSEFVKEKLIAWYRLRAEDKIPERVREYAQLIGKQPAKILMKDQVKRWGSCSNSGVLRFNWRIIMAPVSVLDHVIVHELCHLAVKDHSEKFWNGVGSIIPDYKKKRRWLKEHSFLLTELLRGR